MSSELRHNLTPLFPSLRGFGSTPELYAATEYRAIERQVRDLLGSVVTFENAAAGAVADQSQSIRAVAWNIERGIHLDAIIDVLRNHPQLADADLYFLTELDFGMARSANRDVAGEIARELGLNGVFVPCYLNLDRGSGLEQATAAENEYAIHGNAFFSRWPIRDAASVRLVNGKDKMRGKEKRIGSQAVALGTVELPGGPLRCASVHLDAHSSRGHRRRQLRMLLDALDRDRELPTLIGGDFNTSTHNTNRAAWAILGFWVRVAMGVRRCLTMHYPYPERFFERRLFKLLERRGYDFRSLNELGATTLDHCILSEKDRSNLKDWLPEWCLAHVERELKPFNNIASLKLDWFAGRGVTATGEPPRVVRNLTPGGKRLSDHDPIVLEFALPASTGRSSMRRAHASTIASRQIGSAAS